MNKLGTVIGFTFWGKARKKSFLITTLILAIVLTIGVNLPYLINSFTGSSGQSVEKIGLVYGNQQAIAEKLKQYGDSAADAGFKFVPYEGNPSADELKQAIENEKIDGYLSFNEAKAGEFPQVKYVSESGDGLSGSIQTVIQTALQGIKTQIIVGDSLNEQQIAALNIPVQIEGEKAAGIGGAQAESSDDGINLSNFIYVYVLLIVFMITNTTTGTMIASEVTSEKSSRIMEILITSVSPLTQMFGKIIGMFLLGLSQIAVFTVVVIVNLMLPHNQTALTDLGFNLSDLSIDVFIYGLIFYILGYFLFATLYAAIGSLVSRTEELGQATMPMTVLTLISFYIGTFSVNAPNTLLLKITSYIPFTSPISMLVRIGMGKVATWEIYVSLAVLAVSIFIFGWISAKIYRTGVLLYGKRPTFKELRKAMKAYDI
ncbi:ABC transporter permease [Paenibacillus sp. CAA11]|uniref:ABC transporter permease n=1 Tax=Paenibacillus sp. CAA11 TaxID=1532905 RepID=UPI000D3D2412|nr:ABC transporter permease [Paenibacillus sp. CAA11]AWB43274.1 ABC transporter permease [Paenibacillus sp. CAA11]